MRILITGASGYLGSKLALTLANDGNEVIAFVRSAAAVSHLQHRNIKVFKGDILQEKSLIAALNDCQQVYHSAAKVGAWDKDPAVFYDVNVKGTRNVLNCALASGVNKVVFTSTCGVIGPTSNKPLTEDHVRTAPFKIDYDLSKKEAEDLVFQYAREGMNVAIASPSKIYGPGIISHSLTANAIIDTFLKKRIVFIPYPGTYMLCLAYLDDIVRGHIQVMEKGAQGEKYILGGFNISYYDFFHKIRMLSGNKGSIVQLPKKVIKAWAYVQELNNKLLNRPIRFTVPSVDHVFNNYIFSSQKAISDLGYTITPLDEALTRTIHYLNK